MIHRLAGLSPDVLMSYLATLGLAKVVATQADQEATLWWDGSTPVLATTVEDLAGFLVETYVPTPVVSPWNGGSGYGAKDKNQRKYLERLTKSSSPRLDGFRRLHQVAAAVMQAADSQNWDKARIVQELRNRAPEEALPWLDTAVVLADENGESRAYYPPVVGTGGNDGRAEFSSTYHQRLADVLPELEANPETSRGYALDLMQGSSTTPLLKAMAAQFDGVGAGTPGSSPFSSTDSLVNPWAFVLMIEGVQTFAATPVRALGEQASRASIPFTVLSSAEGPIPGSDGESGRGEVWAPMWSEPMKWGAVQHLFSQAKASWDGATAKKSADMYAAARSMGVDRRVSELRRFGILERNGLAHTAVHLDRVTIQRQPGIELAGLVQHRATRFRQDFAAAIRSHWRHQEHQEARFLQEGRPEDLVAWLATVTQLENAAGLTPSGRDTVGWAQRQPPASQFLPFLSGLLAGRTEYRVGAGLASGRFKDIEDREWSLHDALVGRAPVRKSDDWIMPLVPWRRGRSVEALSELVVWRSLHSANQSAGAASGFRSLWGHRSGVHWEDVHLWVAGELDDALVETALLGFMGLDWRTRGERSHRSETGLRGGHAASTMAPIPALALLQAFEGEYILPPDTAAEQGPVGDKPLREVRAGLRRDWPTRLRAGGASATRVLTEAAAILSRSKVVGPGLEVSPSRFEVAEVTLTVPPERLLAGLCAPTSLRPLRDFARPVGLSISESNDSVEQPEGELS